VGCTGRLSATVLICAAISVCTLTRPDGLYAQSARNVLPNGSFEDNTTGSNAPDGWTRQMWIAGPELTRDPEVAREGLWSVRIDAPSANDTAWTQTITGLTPDANYLLSGWIRTEGITPSDPAAVGGTCSDGDLFRFLRHPLGPLAQRGGVRGAEPPLALQCVLANQRRQSDLRQLAGANGEREGYRSSRRLGSWPGVIPCCVPFAPLSSVSRPSPVTSHTPR
jgi:hypothetical protein